MSPADIMRIFSLVGHNYKTSIFKLSPLVYRSKILMSVTAVKSVNLSHIGRRTLGEYILFSRVYYIV